ncbi:ATP-binding protein, partial [Streptomyces sp. NRRL S-87]|uniref:ATP-binding protein n=1 Tax=Streptomyces sp. NRRL S-87 TaxID=1463920 RepID=UPI0004C2596E
MTNRHDVRNYAPRQDSVTAARRRTAWLAVAWGYPEVSADAALVTSELATNAILHGSVTDRLVRVEVSLSRSALRIAVSDPRGERHPIPRHAGPDDQFGRGLHIVEALSSRWAVTPRSVGKTTWAELPLSERQSGP